MHLDLAGRLMAAVELAGVSADVVNAAYPDVVNTVLSRYRKGPLIGIGNVANPVPAIRYAAADTLAVSVARVSVRMAATRYTSNRLTRKGDGGDVEFYLRILLDSLDVTHEVDLARILRLLPTQYRRLGGVRGQAMTAASAVAVLEALVSEHPTVVHAPGPAGLLGGYPVRASNSGVTVDIAAPATLAAVAAMNEAALVHDGIASVGDDGTVTFCEASVAAMNHALGLRMPKLNPSDARTVADELSARYQRFASKHGERRGVLAQRDF
jgi:hypothetical protein